MKANITSCGSTVANIETDDMNVLVRMIAVTIADDYRCDEEVYSIEDIVIIRAIDRGHFYWGGPTGDLYMVSFS